MKNKIFKIVGILLLIFMLGILEIQLVMYNIKIEGVTDRGIMLSIFNQCYYYDYDVE